MSREIKYLVIHSTGTPPNHRGIPPTTGYHYVIERNGEPRIIQREWETADNIPQVDESALHIAYIGGKSMDGILYDNSNYLQQDGLKCLLASLCTKYPDAKIVGHCDLDPAHKGCPGFDVKEWLQEYESELNVAA
jgi:N-acetylmuramoyl-L-alanine amidase